MSAIEPYEVSVPGAKLEGLAQKLSFTNLPDELEEAHWNYGAPLTDVKRLSAYWKDGFNWKDIEAKINKLPNYCTTIQADGFEPLKIHFVHQKSEVQGAIPLLFCHGWPGSFLEVEKLLPLLAGGGKDSPAFDIVAPSLPNFGFSEGTKKRGFGFAQYAETCHKLMLKLGYKEYVTQGGDWGSMITRTIGLLYPESCKASHINMIDASAPKWTSQPLLALQHVLTPYSKRDQEGLARSQWFLQEGRGYAITQSTKPQTLGYALADSPVGLLAWIYEKLHDWTDSYPWTDDEILTWVSIYWFSTAGPAASLRIYYEALHETGSFGVNRSRTWQWIGGVKLGLGYFPKELVVMPKTHGRTLGPVVYENDHKHGGHFAATENPEGIANDLKKMFGTGGGAYGVIRGKNGYDLRSSRL